MQHAAQVYHFKPDKIVIPVGETKKQIRQKTMQIVSDLNQSGQPLNIEL